jgi:hypothetical protein
MVECDLKPYCNEDCNQCDYGGELKQRQTLAEAVEDIRNAFLELFEPIFDLASRMVNMLEGFKDRKVAHLAAHHKKKRIRKKNMKRILKWMKKRSDSNVED